MNQVLKKLNWVSLLMGLFTIVVCVCVAFPFFWLLSGSLKRPDELFTKTPHLIPRRGTLRNYLDIWQGTLFVRYFLNTLVVSSTTTTLVLILAAPAGYSLARFTFVGKRAIGWLLLGLQMFSAIFVVIPLFSIFARLRLIDTYVPLIITHTAFSLPFAIWLFRGYLSSLPVEIEEAARVDGCGTIQLLWRIVLPLALPGLVIVSLFVFMFSWQEYLFSLTLTKSMVMRTLSVGISFYLGFREILWGRLMAASVLMVLPIMVSFTYLQKYLVRGLTLGAIK